MENNSYSLLSLIDVILSVLAKDPVVHEKILHFKIIVQNDSRENGE